MKSATMHHRLTTRLEHVFWDGVEVEHINIDAQEDYDWDALAERCLHIESLGLRPSSSTVIWHWDWFETMPYDSIYRELMGHTPSFYEHGCTPECARMLRESNVHTPITESDGTIAVFNRGKAVRWDGCVVEPLLYSEEIAEDQGIYHAMRALHYRPAQMGQPACNGPCYATYDQVEAWLDSHAVDIGGALAIRRALGLGFKTRETS